LQIDFVPCVLLSLLVIGTPGPDTAVTTKHALLSGRRGGLRCALGVVTGLAIWTVAAAVGLAALLRASGVAFLTLKLVGAAYLVWIGVQMLRSRGTAVPHAARTGGKAYRQGLLSNLGNPKIAVFFTSFLPQFVHGGTLFLALLLLGAIFCTITVAWLTIYVVAISRGASALRRPAVRRVLDRVTGVVLVALGIRLAFEHR
jgi:RhtB (resistance to homoserine/threonine) family protein